MGPQLPRAPAQDPAVPKKQYTPRILHFFTLPRFADLKLLDVSECPGIPENELAVLAGLTCLRVLNLNGLKFKSILACDYIAKLVPVTMMSLNLLL